MTAASKNGPKKRGAPFKPGHPGGPGRPAGSRNKATLLLDQMGDDAAKAVLAKIIAKAKKGDMRAADMILARVWPVRKGRPVPLDLPKLKTAADVVAAMGVVADAVGTGQLTPEEAQAISTVLENKRRAIETVALEARVSALEKERK